MDDEDFLAAVEADNALAPVEDATAEAQPPEPEAKDPPEPAPEPAAPAQDAPAEPQPEAKPEPIMVPLAALHETRDEVKELKAKIARYEQQPQPQPQIQPPDPIEDPEGFAQFQEQRFQQQLLNQTLNTSERFARKEHGVETVEAAKQWSLQRFQTDPLYQAQVLRDPDPYERIVSDYRRDQLFSQVSDPKEFEQFQAWKAAQGQLQQQQGGQPPPPNQAPSIPPRSLASAPSAGSVLMDVVQSDDEIFDEVIPKRK
jgi:hypothetical protein